MMIIGVFQNRWTKEKEKFAIILYEIFLIGLVWFLKSQMFDRWIDGWSWYRIIQ